MLNAKQKAVNPNFLKSFVWNDPDQELSTYRFAGKRSEHFTTALSNHFLAVSIALDVDALSLIQFAYN